MEIYDVPNLAHGVPNLVHHIPFLVHHVNQIFKRLERAITLSKKGAMNSFVLSDESVNCYGFWIKTEGIDLSQFSKNPLMLWMHNRPWRGTTDEVLPIGKWENTRTEKATLIGDPVFDESDDFAVKLKKKVEGGFLKMASIGIEIIETSTDPKLLKPGQTRATVTKCKLREVSLVDLGANDNALSLAFYNADGEMIELSAKDGKGTELPIPLLELSDSNNQKSQKMKKLVTLLGLADNAGEDAIAESIEKLQNDKKQAKDKLAAYELKQLEEEEKEAKALVAEAIKDGRLNADGEADWLNAFKENHQGSKARLAAIPKRQSVTKELKDDNEVVEETYASLSKSNPSRLAEIKRRDPAKFAQLEADYLASKGKSEKK